MTVAADTAGDARRRALDGARLARAENISHEEAAQRVGSNVYWVTECYLVLAFGTPDEIASIERGAVTIRAAADAIRARTTKEDRRVARKAGAGRNSPDSEIEIRKRAFQGARIVIKEGISHVDAAQRLQISRRAISSAYVILAHCSPEQIAKAEIGEISLALLVDHVRKNVPADIRKSKRKGPIFDADTRKQRDTEVALWNTLRDALDGIAAMPQPQDIVRIVKKHRMREEKVNEKLIAAFAWITEFSDAWTR